jgi:sugar phosphate permease
VIATALEPRSRLAKWQATNLALLVIGYSGYYLCRSNLSVAMPLIIQDLGRRGIGSDAARVSLGSVASLGVLAYAIGKFPSGSLADLFGGRRNFLFGMSGSIVFTLLFAASGSLPLFTFAWMGNRLVQSLGWAGAVKIASRWFPFRQYGTVMAVISLSYLFGDAAARQFLGLLIANGAGWRGVFFWSAGVLVLIAPGLQPATRIAFSIGPARTFRAARQSVSKDAGHDCEARLAATADAVFRKCDFLAGLRALPGHNRAARNLQSVDTNLLHAGGWNDSW